MSTGKLQRLFLLFCAFLFVKALIPCAQIQEGLGWLENSDDERKLVRLGMPAIVASKMRAMLPANEQDPTTSTANLFVQTREALFQGDVLFSRIVNAINWSGFHPLLRTPHSFYTAYQFPENALGSEFCFQGTTFWQESLAFVEKTHARSKACIKLTADKIGKVIYGISNGTSLAVEFRPAAKLRFFQALTFGVTCFFALLGFLLLSPSTRKGTI